MVFLVKRLLSKRGFRVSGFEVAAEALAAVRAEPGDFDLVVTDFNMPKASGLDVARAIAQIRPGLSVVITSGYISDALREGAREAGVRHLVYKPNSVEELTEVIRRLLEPENG
jgi:two-component system cell cycle sensor histidine kinase/response regulator CckA